MKYSLRRIAAPSEPVITIEEARDQLRVDAYGSPPSHPEDDLIMSYVEAITQDLDAGTGWLGRALAPQTWAMSLDAFALAGASCRIALPYPPLIEILSITWTDTDGTVNTMVEDTDYRLILGSEHAFIAPLYQSFWPSNIRDDYDTFVITFRCGYASGSPEAAAIPELVKRYVKAALTEAYDNRDVYENALTKRGEMTDRIPNTLNSIRVRNSQ